MYTFKGMPIHICEKASPLDLYFIQPNEKCPFCGESMMEEQARARHGSPLFYALLEEMANTHDKKSHDYANNDNPYGNYYFAGQVAAMFSHSPLDAGFAGRIGEKIFRLANLESSNRIPKNETIEDTERDIAVIAVLWMAARRDWRNRSVNQYRETDQCVRELSPEEKASEAASCSIIDVSRILTPKHLRDMISYLQEIEKSANSPSK